MVLKLCVSVFVVFLSYLICVASKGTGSGTSGNLRLCIVEGRGSHKRAPMHCPILDREKSGVECVIGTDRLDCLRRISKGTVDFGVFSPEDLVAAQWADVDVLVTNELRRKSRDFARNIVAVVNKKILPDSSSNIHAVLRNRTLCHPGETMDDIRPLSETLSGYLESLILERSCDPKLSNTENKLKSLSDFYGKACKAGPWVPDKTRDAELKRQFPSLCAACGSPQCSQSDRYWGNMGALNCITEGAGMVTWAEVDDVKLWFKLGNTQSASLYHENFVYLCRDGTWRKLNEQPCVWLRRPWNIIVAKRKAAEAVKHLAQSLTNRSVIVDQHWKGSLISLLEMNQALPEPLDPPQAPIDYLARSEGFSEAYNQAGCNPSRHIILCTPSLLERNKCEWMSEAGAVYGVVPSIQCFYRDSTIDCLKAVASGECDAAVGDSDYLVTASRLSLQPLLHEITPIVEKTNTVFAYVKNDSQIKNMADLRGKRAAFPRYDGASWHSVLRYICKKENLSCKDYEDNYFKKICAPGLKDKNCYPAGEIGALRSLIEGKSDVAFISMNTFNAYKNNLTKSELESIKNIEHLCPEDNKKYCFISWSTLGHIFTSKNLSNVRKHEIINVFTKLDQLFGKHPPFHLPMFSLYGPYNHEMEVIFHSDTKNLVTNHVLKMHPYDKIPFNYELSISNVTNFSCSFGAKITPSFVFVLLTLVAYFSS